MTATILLIRHAAHAQLGAVLSGRTAGGPLTDAGVGQAEGLARLLRGEALASVLTSPVQRACQTAEILAAAHGLDAVADNALDEVDFGSWTGERFDELERDPAWKRWNEHRAEARAPGGETMIQVQDRVFGCMRTAAERHPGKMLAMVSHCDVIRAAIARVMGLSLDNLLRFEIAPASVSRVEVGSWGARVLSMNEVRA